MAQTHLIYTQAIDQAVLDPDAAAVAAALVDPAAFAVLYRRYATDVYRYCYRRLGEREAAEDATSHIFTRAITGLPGLKGRPFRPWLFTIARNVVIDAWRQHHPTSPLDLMSEREDPSPSPESAAIAVEERSAIRLLLLRLPERDRQIMELRLAGLNGLEVAEALGCSHGAVRVAHHRALERLRELIVAEGMMTSEQANKDKTNASS